MAARIPLTTLLLAILVTASAQSAEVKYEVDIAVMNFASKGGVTQEQMEALGDLLTTEVQASCQCNVVGRNDIKAALQLEQQKMLLGCSDDSCLAEIGGALGVRWLCVGNISKFGQAFLLNLRMIDTQKVKLAGAASVKVRGGEAQLISALPQAVRELMSQANKRIWPDGDGPEITGATGLKEAGETPFPYGTVGYATFFSGVGLAALGGAGAGLMASARSDYKGGDFNAEGDIKTWTGVMFAGFGAGVALMTTGVVMWLLNSDEASAATNAGLVPIGDGMGVGLTGRW